MYLNCLGVGWRDSAKNVIDNGANLASIYIVICKYIKSVSAFVVIVMSGVERIPACREGWGCPEFTAIGKTWSAEPVMTIA